MALLVWGILFTSFSQGNAISIRSNAACGFHLSTSSSSGEISVGQLSNGQARAGKGIKPSVFTWFGDAFLDQQGRGCWWTPPTSVLQCDINQQPDHRFEIGCDGTLSYLSQSTFYQCQTGDDDQVNIYLSSSGGNCQPISLVTSGCGSLSPQPQPQPTVHPAPVLPPAPVSCPPDLDGPFESPHLIIPIDKAHPTKPYGSSLFGQVSENASTIFNFDIPLSSAATDQSCKTIFAFPTKDQLQTSSYFFTGDGLVSFARLGEDVGVGLDTTYDKAVEMGRGERELGVFELRPGNTYVIESFECKELAGREVVYVMMVAKGYGDGVETCLVYFQDWNPSPIGLFIRKC
ncbi:ubiquitin 3 binding protein But2 C-terminal domain-containing protein [Pseudomassariella vexata]|uniref:Ubiquitin 3 binding protein But2 C-terminal domain-domain-containing protein n=1 Tax=Pseudomassariella vexata TaxID=1141098 RepID=A0A1Y2EFC2_9PEZI|nr:ubiquitin 3 binding protein But2 C-terminal domain-containing protein [Pseudomassariella vexata]ORY70281.1 ubiquitin 3 binding protein But2 C-terminal domain-domain-containing protein [Pseudomassariella vexata]